MKIITTELLGVVSTYKDPFNMPLEWHKTELKKIAPTASVRSFKSWQTNSHLSLEALEKLETIEDLMIRAKI